MTDAEMYCLSSLRRRRSDYHAESDVVWGVSEIASLEDEPDGVVMIKYTTNIGNVVMVGNAVTLEAVVDALGGYSDAEAD